MKLSIPQAELVRALTRIQGITEKRSTMPILTHVLLEASDSGLKLSATDMEIGVTGRCACEVHQDGSLAVAAKQLHEIARSLPNREVHLTMMDNWWLHVQCGRTEYKIVGLNPVDFPRIMLDDDINTVDVPAKILSAMIDRTIFCTSQDETRKHLRGVYCEWDTENSLLRMAATDGHRLTLAEEKLEKCIEQPSVIVPRKAFAELRRILGEVDGDSPVKIGFSEKRGQVQIGDTVLTITLIEGKFPNYRRVIPTGNDKILRVNRHEFMAALKRTSIVSRDKDNTVSVTPHEGSVTIAAQNPDLGEAREDLEANYEGNEFTACFNARYVLDVLQLHHEDEIQLEMADEISPTLVCSPTQQNFLAVVMPMRP